MARRLAEAVEERTRLPVSFEFPAPAPADNLPLADDPSEETYEHGRWIGGDPPGDERIDDDWADGAEHDWLYQRRNGYDEIYDPWAPEEVEERRRNRVEREEERYGNEEQFDPDDEDWTGGEDGPEDTDSAPNHDIS